MASEAFNSLGGYTIGIPPISIVDSNGNVVTNVLAPNGNITANKVYSNSYFFANGLPLTAAAAGSNTQVQFNSDGNFGANANFTFNSTTNLLSVPSITLTGNVNLGDVANLVIYGGNNGFFLQTDGTGNLSWAAGGGGGGNGSPGGANSQLQYNSAGTFAGSPNLEFDDVTNLLTVTGNITANTVTANLIGTASNALVANTVRNAAQPNITSLGTLTSLATLGNISTLANINAVNANLGNAAYANYFIGNLYGTSNAALVANTVVNNAQPNITSVGTLTTLVVSGNITGGNANLGNLAQANYFTSNVSNANTFNAVGNINANIVNSNLFVGNGQGLTNIPAANLVGSVPLAAQVSDNAQPNITSVGTLTGLTLTGLLSSNSNVSTTANVTANNINISRTVFATNGSFMGNITVGGNLTVGTLGGKIAALGNVDTTQSPNITLGTVSNIHITGGFNGYYLQTDGTGNLTWSDPGGGGGGNGSPGGANTQVQYNFAGDFGGSPFFTWNNETTTLTVGGNLVANTFTIGSGIYKFAQSFVEFLTTSATANVIMYSLPADEVSSVDYTIISTNPSAENRQVSKISSVVYGSQIYYNEYNTLFVNGLTANFTIDYLPGNIVANAQIVLYVTPTSADPTTHKICITAYAE